MSDSAHKNHAPWSLSKANVARDCTLRFHLQYVARQKGKPPTNNAGKIGAAVHDYVDGRTKGQPVSSAFLFAAQSNKLTRGEQHTLLEFRDPTERFLRRMERFRKDYEAKGYSVTFNSERRVAFTRDLEDVEDWFRGPSYWRGALDLEIVLEKDGEVRVFIIDHKTGNPSHDKHASYANQTQSYAVAALGTHGDRLTAVHTAIHWLREDIDDKSVVWFPTHNLAQVKNTLLPWFYEFYDEAQVRTESPPVPTPGKHCTWCPFSYKCPVAQQG